MKTSEHIRAAEALLKHTFKDRELLRAALTHPSAAEGRSIAASYERLEFLGDSVLGAIVARDLFLAYPQSDEGELSRLKTAAVSGKTLSHVADELGIAELIFFGASESGTGSRGLTSALENVYEALVGALYLDAGYDAAHAFVSSTLGSRLTTGAKLIFEINPKSRLQEYLQKRHEEVPTYKLVLEQGPAHSPTFTSVAFSGKTKLGRGSGSSKKQSELAAALDALKRLGCIDNKDQTETV